MDYELTKQMKCAIGEQLASVQLMARGWPTVNVNNSIDNFKGIDLFCQHGTESKEIVGIQVKTTFQGIRDNISIGMNNKEAANIEVLKKKITGPWVFVHVKDLGSWDIDFYILTVKQMIDLVYGLHHWYLKEWERRPCTESLEKGMAGIRIAHLLGNLDSSKFSDTKFNNPMVGVDTKNKWDNIWVKNEDYT